MGGGPVTATYDGKLVVTKNGIAPCCGSMHRMIFSGAVYRGSTGATMIAYQMNPKKGLALANCPFCGAEAEQ